MSKVRKEKVYGINSYPLSIECSEIERETPKMYILKDNINYKKRFFKDEVCFSVKSAKEKLINRKLSSIEGYTNSINDLKAEIEKIRKLKED